MKINKKIKIGLIAGIIFGLIDVTPMVFMKMTWDIIVSALVMCVVGGFLIATSELRIKYWLKGAFLFFLVGLPTIILVGGGSPQEIMPMVFSNLVLGSLMGLVIGKFLK